MSYFLRPSRLRKATPNRDVSSNNNARVNTQKYPSPSEHPSSESTLVIEDEWYTASEHGSEPSSPGTIPEVVTLLEGCLDSKYPVPMGKTTQVLQGTSTTTTTTAVSPGRVCRVVSVDSASFASQEDIEQAYSPTRKRSSHELPPQLNLSTWRAVSPLDYPIRSATYLQNRRKLAVEKAAMSLWAVDLVQTDEPLGMCEHSKERFQKSLRQGTAPAFCFAVNICLPAPKGGAKVKGSFYQFVAYFGVDDKAQLFDESKPVGRLMSRFCHGEDSDTFRNETFKLIPKIAHGGGFVFRQAVGSKPVLLGQKVSQTYFRTEDYCEVFIDIASDPIAKRIVRMALGLATHLTVDLSFCLEGKSVETLPEQLLGGFRVQGLSFSDDGQRFVESETCATSL